MESIKLKIQTERSKGKKTAIIKSDPNSIRSIWYLTLGSFPANIEYEEEINLSNKLFVFKVRFHGKDLWDFKEVDCEGREDFEYLECFFHNLFEEYLPSLFVGDGKPFYVKYDFYDYIVIDENKYDIYIKNYPQINKENSITKKNKNDSNNKFFIIFIVVVVIIIIIILVYLLKKRNKNNNINNNKNKMFFKFPLKK